MRVGRRRRLRMAVLRLMLMTAMLTEILGFECRRR